MSNDFCIILAGGVGKRLWPCSRRNVPKQFIDFTGVGRTLLQQTFDRYARFIPRENIYVSTFRDYAGLVAEQLPELPAANVLAEPVQLSTAPAAVWASCHISRLVPEANIVVTPSDQFIADEEKFGQQIRAGLEFVAAHGDFLAVGAKPTVPNTAYGYIQSDGNGVGQRRFGVQSFSEKPAPEYARMFVESGEFLWNTGIFLWNARTMADMIHCLAPMAAEYMTRNADGFTAEEETEFMEKVYPASLRVTIDTVLLERCRNLRVQECDFGWADIGCWPALREVAGKDADGNAVLGGGRVMFSGCRNNLVRLPEGMGAVVRGLEGYLVAMEGNMLVVCPNDDPALARRLGNEAGVRLGEEFL